MLNYLRKITMWVMQMFQILFFKTRPNIESKTQIEQTITDLNIVPRVIENIVMNYVGTHFYDRHDNPKIVKVLNGARFEHVGNLIFLEKRGGSKFKLWNINQISNPTSKTYTIPFYVCRMYADEIFLICRKKIYVFNDDLQNFIRIKKLNFQHLRKLLFFENWILFVFRKHFVLFSLLTHKRIKFANRLFFWNQFFVLNSNVYILNFNQQWLQIYNSLSTQTTLVKISHFNFFFLENNCYLWNHNELVQLINTGLKRVCQFPTWTYGFVCVIQNQVYYYSNSARRLFHLDLHTGLFVFFANIAIVRSCYHVEDNCLFYSNGATWCMFNIQTKINYQIPNSQNYASSLITKLGKGCVGFIQDDHVSVLL